MNNRKDIVDILIKYSTGSKISEEEAKLLEDWKASSEKNAQLFSELTDEEIKIRHLKVFSAIDPDEDWNAMKKHMLFEKKTKIYFFRKAMPYAAAIIIGLLLWLVKYTVSEYQQIESSGQINQKVTDIPPAKHGAILILSDGRKVELNQNANIKNNQGLTLTSTEKELQVRTNSEEQVNSSEFNVLVVPKGAYYSIVLPDQTKVWVNANSKLTFPNVFSKKERRVKVEGEAFFEVSHDADHPFYVETKGMQVKVLGTKFNVNAYSESVKTTLENGKVELTVNNQKAMLLPGQSGEWNEGKLQIKQANVTKELAWKRGEFYFENDDIVHIASELSRWYDVEVKFVGNINVKKQFSGSINRNITLAKVLDVLRYASDFDFEIREKELVIRNK